MAEMKLVNAEQLDADFTAIASAIRGKNGSTEKYAPGDMAAAISAIQTGGGGGGATKDYVNFYDYEGTLLYSYSKDEVEALTELPPLPSHDGLICQGWNWSLEDIKAEEKETNVGAMYITDDGKTRLYITIAAEGRMDVPLYFNQSVANGVTIDWGDGSVTETLAGTGKVNTTHTYASIGDYVISLDVAEGCALGLGYNSNYYTVMGSIGYNGRVYCNMLRKVEIGSSVTSIDTYAFGNCYSLTSVTIPEGVTSIDTYAFYYCYSLASVTIPEGVTSIDKGSFYYCYSLTSVTIPEGVTSIDTYPFYYCYSLASVTIPEGVTSIGANAFQSCYSLASITIPDSVTSIDTYTFCACSSLASVTIPEGVTSIGANAFQACYSLASVTIPEGVTSIDAYTFGNCSGIKFYDFSKHTAVPTLTITNAFTGIPSDCEIRVPAALYDEWIAATNWSTYAANIVAV